MYHSITFGDKNTFDDWHLIPTSRPVIAPPPFRSHTEDIPGGFGSLDLSEALTGYPLYDNRTGSLEFAVINDAWSDWSLAYQTILNHLHGRRMKMILEDDPSYYYIGRFTVDNWDSGENYSTITIKYDLYPYKKQLVSTSEQWVWNSFDFDYGYIAEYFNLAVNGSLSVTVKACGEPTVPVITSTASMTVTVNGKTYNLSAGRNYITSLVAPPNTDTTYKFTGNGTISIDYRGGVL